MGEIMDANYDAAWRATTAAHEGAEQAKRDIEPRLAFLEQENAMLRSRVKNLEEIIGLNK